MAASRWPHPPVCSNIALAGLISLPMDGQGQIYCFSRDWVNCVMKEWPHDRVKSGITTHKSDSYTAIHSHAPNHQEPSHQVCNPHRHEARVSSQFVRVPGKVTKLHPGQHKPTVYMEKHAGVTKIHPRWSVPGDNTSMSTLLLDSRNGRCSEVLLTLCHAIARACREPES